MKKRTSRSAARDPRESAFRELWTSLFETQSHLDSALHRQDPALRADLAEAILQLLLMPSSFGEALLATAMRTTLNAPWSDSPQEKARWSLALPIAQAYWSLSDRERQAFRVTGGLNDFPPAMLEEWAQDWGPDVVATLVESLSQRPKVTLRVSRRAKVDAVWASIAAELGLESRSLELPLLPGVIRLPHFAPVLKTQAFRDGLFELQDEGSQAMALFALEPEKIAPFLTESPATKGAVVSDAARVALRSELLQRATPRTVVDACAGAGGKTLALSDAMGGRGRVYAYDAVPGKLAALKRRATRAGLNNIQTRVIDEGSESEGLRAFWGKADVVLVDAPCSGWGVLRRNPDIKWRQTAAEVARMAPLQLRLLREYSKGVRAGGRLVFGLCTFRKEESLDVVRKFLDLEPEFTQGVGGFWGPGDGDCFFMQSFYRK
jgi:16S rRNA C967 or C1407 C5-methylase (RsmB/RsmF family)